jgi:hypothetical protein
MLAGFLYAVATIAFVVVALAVIGLSVAIKIGVAQGKKHRRR